MAHKAVRVGGRARMPHGNCKWLAKKGWGRSTRLYLQCPLLIENTFYRENILESLQGLVCPVQWLPSPLPTAEAKIPLRSQEKRTKHTP